MNVIKVFKEREVSGIIQIANRVKTELDSFKHKVPLLIAFKCEGIKMRHWAELFKLVKQPIENNLSLERAVELGFLDHII